MGIFRTINEVLKLYNQQLRNFDPSIAPWRYHKIRNALDSKGDLGFLGAVAIYGLRRTGKTLSALQIGKLANEKGYTVLYTDLENPLFGFDVMKKGEAIGEALEIAHKFSDDKLLIIVDEAFSSDIRVLHKFLEVFRGLYEEKVRSKRYDFGILLLGSYGTDIERLGSYIYRTLPPKFMPPIIISTPRICRKDKPSLPYINLEIFNKEPGHVLREEFIAILSSNRILNGGYLGEKALRIYEEYESTLGMPEVLSGYNDVKSVIRGFNGLLEESIARFKSIVELSKDEKVKYEKISIANIKNTLISLLGYRPPRKYDEKDAKLIEFVLNLGLIIPRRFIKLEDLDVADLLYSLEVYSLPEILSKYGIQATPAHLFGSRIIRTMSKTTPELDYESIVAHCLIHNAISRYDTTLPRLPILSTEGIDFVYIYKDALGDYHPILFEVKSGKRIRRIINEGIYEYDSRKELDKALETAESLGRPLTIITPETDRFFIARKYIPGIIDGKEVPIYVIPIEAFVAMACLYSS